MKRALLLAACAGCTSTQSARTVAPGKTELSVGLGRASDFEQNVGDGNWLGHMMVRFGLVDGFDFGLHALHTPGEGGIGALAIDPKVRLTQAGKLALSVGSPVGIVWGEAPEVSYQGWFFLPAAYFGVQVDPSVELVATIRGSVSLAEGDPARTGYGVAFAPRFTDETHTWAVQPELGFLRAEDGTFLTLGLTIVVGNGGP